ncbi:MAG: Peptidase and subtilisin, kexin, sedolisin [Acidobacteria bacterium]|nr:Peptidase and subtilisin, kexin, sedolisin [Acidobacteriota bacterium]
MPSWNAIDRNQRLPPPDAERACSPLELVRLTGLMERTKGSPQVKIGLIDGPVVAGHVDLPVDRLLGISRRHEATCSYANSDACMHGTFVAGLLCARRGSLAPSICPGCTLLIRPLFAETALGRDRMPASTPFELAAAVLECIEAGARIINLSLALARPSINGERALEQALDQALRRGVIVVAAAGNQGILGSSPITRHLWVIPVVGCDAAGRPIEKSNLGRSVGSRGLLAPGIGITSLGVVEKRPSGL